MYAKFVIYDENDDLFTDLGISDKDGNSGPDMVVPYGNKLFEGKRFSYNKIRVKDRTHYYKVVESICNLTVLSSVPDEEIFEFILLAIHNEEGVPKHYLSAADSALFIMNNNGKTIDKLVCRNQH